MAPEFISPKTKAQQQFSSMTPILYVLREQRLVWFFVGIAIPAIVFTVIIPSPLPVLDQISHDSFHSAELTHVPRSITLELHGSHMNAGTL